MAEIVMSSILGCMVGFSFASVIDLRIRYNQDHK